MTYLDTAWKSRKTLCIAFAETCGIPELIEEGVSGMTFESGNVEDLARGIQAMFDATFDYAGVAAAAQTRYNSEAYYERIMLEYKG